MIPQRIEQVLAPELVGDDDTAQGEGSRRRLFSLTNRSPSPTLGPLSPPRRAPSPLPQDLIAHSFGGASTPTYSWCGDDIEFKVSLEWKNVAQQPENTVVSEEYQPWTMEKFVEVMLPRKDNEKAAHSHGENTRFVQWIMLSSFLLSKADCPPPRPNIPSLRDLDAMKKGNRTSSTAYSVLHSKKMRNAHKSAMSSWLPNTDEAASARRNLNFIGAEPCQAGLKDTSNIPRTNQPMKAKYTDAFKKMHGKSSSSPTDQASRLQYSLSKADMNNVPVAPPEPSNWRPPFMGVVPASSPVPSSSRPPLHSSPVPSSSRPPLPKKLDPKDPETSPSKLIKLAPMTATIEIASGGGLLQAVASARRGSSDSGTRGVPVARLPKPPKREQKVPDTKTSFIPENLQTFKVPNLQA